ncbi:uncharacterized protein YbjT (DUF2867 family) [Streptomyces africanus]|uniref:Uncharacterized protein YbjT (DUF2867 family) n=1 Tax=Streptomyces africanus TaxID=231024 RepID=A0ABU0QTW2_9ACTN|nr:uncharacterized protein YbjT (DUF2867 family) [Streptomyces africanus]
MSIIVTGATGNLGRHVVEQLLEKVPAEQITAVVRNAEKAARLRGARCEDRTGRLQRPGLLRRALLRR